MSFPGDAMRQRRNGDHPRKHARARAARFVLAQD
jgi:hypothetical protein